MKTYKLEGQQVVPCELMEWAMWMGLNAAERMVGKTDISGSHVSTVFVGLSPHLWETTVFPGKPRMVDGELVDCHDISQDRCAGSWHRAEEMHKRMCAKVAGALGVPWENYFDEHGTLRNPDGSRSIFDDVDE